MDAEDVLVLHSQLPIALSCTQAQVSQACHATPASIPNNTAELYGNVAHI